MGATTESKLRSALLQVTRERDEARRGYEALDRNWHAVHEAAMGAIREALGNPNATVPEICEALRRRSELAEVEEDA